MICPSHCRTRELKLDDLMHEWFLVAALPMNGPTTRMVRRHPCTAISPCSHTFLMDVYVTEVMVDLAVHAKIKRGGWTRRS